MIEIKIDKFNLEIVDGNTVMNHLKKLAEKQRELIQERTPVKTGKLKRSIGLRKIEDGFELFFKSGKENEIANYQHFGTKTHLVQPVKKQALHWDKYFSKGHIVRGIKATKFFSFMSKDKPILINLFKKLRIFKRA